MKLPWPLWNRQVVCAVYRVEKEDGSIWNYAWSVRHPRAKLDADNLVEIYLHVGYDLPSPTLQLLLYPILSFSLSSYPYPPTFSSVSSLPFSCSAL